MDPNTQKVAERLNALLREELAAVETYSVAVTKIKSQDVKNALTPVKAAHEKRIPQLIDQIKKVGGQPASNSGLWGRFEKLIEQGSAAFGDKAAVGALEECEVKSLADYKFDIEDLDADSHKLVMSNLLPDQQQVYEIIAKLHKTIH
jgi:hypothetical protein